jgi:hypothetical protein
LEVEVAYFKVKGYHGIFGKGSYQWFSEYIGVHAFIPNQGRGLYNTAVKAVRYYANHIFMKRGEDISIFIWLFYG